MTKKYDLMFDIGTIILGIYILCNPAHYDHNIQFIAGGFTFMSAADIARSLSC